MSDLTVTLAPGEVAIYEFFQEDGEGYSTWETESGCGGPGASSGVRTSGGTPDVVIVNGYLTGDGTFTLPGVGPNSNNILASWVIVCKLGEVVV